MRSTPSQCNGRIVVPPPRRPGGIQAWKTIIPPESGEPELRTHEGYEWPHVLGGRVRLFLADHDSTPGPGGSAEFDTRLPHRFGPAGDMRSRSSA